MINWGTMVVGDCGGEGWGGTQHKGGGIRARIYVHLSLCLQSHILICPARLLDSFDLRDRKENVFLLKLHLPVVSLFTFTAKVFFFLPDSSSEERIKRVKPVMHLFVISGLKQYSTVFCTHGECVRGLLKERKKADYLSVAPIREPRGGMLESLVNHRPSASLAGPRCTPPEQRRG